MPKYFTIIKCIKEAYQLRVHGHIIPLQFQRLLQTVKLPVAKIIPQNRQIK